MKNEQILKDTVFFGTGAIGYGAMEISCRGFTHPSMLLAGGICFLTISKIAKYSKLHFGTNCVLGGGVITTVEFLFGYICNVVLKLNVWDYSDQPLNIMGQICPKFFGIWCALSAGGIFLAKVMDLKLSGKPLLKPKSIPLNGFASYSNGQA